MTAKIDDTSVHWDLSSLGTITNLLDGNAWSGPEILNAVAARRDQLKTAGIEEGRNVVIAHGGTPEFFVDLFSVWSLGACASCTNSDLTDAELINVAEFTDSGAILLGPRPRPTASNGLTFIEGLPAKAGDAATSFQIEAPQDAHALILFTSGTTGDPKGVVHSFGTLANRITCNQEQISKDIMGRTLCVLPTHFGHGLIGNCLTPLLAGADLFLAAGGGLMVAAKLGAYIDDNEISFMSSVPAFWKIALKASKAPSANSIKQIHVGSAPVAAELIHAIAEWSGTNDVRNMYGITETANWVAGGSLKDRQPQDGLIGPMWGGKAAVSLADGTRAETGEGEILLQPPSLMLGYLKRPDLTSEVIRDGWYHTGDTGTIDANGVIQLTGRIKNEINRGGMKVSPEEIDLLLEKHEHVVEACAFGMPDEVAGETVAAAVVFQDDSDVSPNDLRSWCMERIRRECVPERWFVLQEIPKTDRGKLNRDNVRNVCQELGQQ